MIAFLKHVVGRHSKSLLSCCWGRRLSPSSWFTSMSIQSSRSSKALALFGPGFSRPRRKPRRRCPLAGIRRRPPPPAHRGRRPGRWRRGRPRRSRPRRPPAKLTKGARTLRPGLFAPAAQAPPKAVPSASWNPARRPPPPAHLRPAPRDRWRRGRPVQKVVLAAHKLTKGAALCCLGFCPRGAKPLRGGGFRFLESGALPAAAGAPAPAPRDRWRRVDPVQKVVLVAPHGGEKTRALFKTRCIVL